jgi:hypothetical protein
MIYNKAYIMSPVVFIRKFSAKIKVSEPPVRFCQGISNPSRCFSNIFFNTKFYTIAPALAAFNLILPVVFLNKITGSFFVSNKIVHFLIKAFNTQLVYVFCHKINTHSNLPGFLRFHIRGGRNP